MNAPIKPALLQAAALPDAAWPTVAGGFRHVWQGKFGSMVIEVVDGQAYVNGEAVEPVRTRAAAEESEPSLAELPVALRDK